MCCAVSRLTFEQREELVCDVQVKSSSIVEANHESGKIAPLRCGEIGRILSASGDKGNPALLAIVEDAVAAPHFFTGLVMRNCFTHAGEYI